MDDILLVENFIRNTKKCNQYNIIINMDNLCSIPQLNRHIRRNTEKLRFKKKYNIKNEYILWRRHKKIVDGFNISWSLKRLILEYIPRPIHPNAKSIQILKQKIFQSENYIITRHSFRIGNIDTFFEASLPTNTTLSIPSRPYQRSIYRRLRSLNQLLYMWKKTINGQFSYMPLFTLYWLKTSELRIYKDYIKICKTISKYNNNMFEEKKRRFEGYISGLQNKIIE
jgi:hypothetical protein